MKIQLTFKTPDALSDALNDNLHINYTDLYNKLSKKYFDYGEFVTIEVTVDEFTGKVHGAKVLENQ